MKKIMTGNYNNCKDGNLVSISGDKGKAALYNGKYEKKLAPKKEFWKKWKENQGGISEEENTYFYIKEYYEKVLSRLDPFEIYNSFDDETILLCYEENEEFCHRHLVAFWLELFLGITTSEVKVNSKRMTYHALKRPDNLKEILEKVIKENYNIHNFDSIKAAYLYNKSKEYENKSAIFLKLSKEEEKNYKLKLKK